MKLYFFPFAPNPTRVRLYLAEKEAGGCPIPLEQVLVNLAEGEQKKPEHLARHPLGQLPVLELDDGIFLTESTAIIEYLEEIHPEPPMIGAEPRARARVRELDRICDLGVLMSSGQLVHTTNSPLGLPPVPEAAALFRERLERFLGVVDDVLSDGRPFVAGDRPSIADGTLAAGLQFARFGKVEIDRSHAHLARWDDAYRERPVAKSVLVV
jgi:glutathione S-transferase